MPDVTSWFYEQLQKKSSAPNRRFLLGGSDYSERVTTWPTIRRKAQEFDIVNLKTKLANQDGGMNFFFDDVYTIPLSGGGRPAIFDFGFTHPTSGDEWLTFYTGELQDVKFAKDNCLLFLRDKIQNLEKTNVTVEGDSGTIQKITFTNSSPGDVVWTLLTSWGSLVESKDSANVDIDYEAWTSWSSIFSRDNITISAEFNGEKVTEALDEMAKMLDSAIYVTGEGKITFRRFLESNDNDHLFDNDDYHTMDIYIDASLMVNKQYVYADYDTSSEEWGIVTFDVNTSSVNSFGLHENVISSEVVWYPTSATAKNFAERMLFTRALPPKNPELTTNLAGAYRDIGETIRLTNSFYNISSSTPWRIIQQEINMEAGSMRWNLTGATAGGGFFLDHDVDSGGLGLLDQTFNVLL